MTVLQLVRGGSDTDLVPNPQQLPPEDFIGRGAFLAGSDDLVRIAVHLSRARFKIVTFSFVDRYFQPVEPEINQKLSDDLLGLIRSGATGARALHAHFGDASVESVRLRDLTTGANIQIAQEGVVRTRSESDVPSLRTGLAHMPAEF